MHLRYFVLCNKKLTYLLT